MLTVGTKFSTNCGDCIVVEDKGWKSVLVKFTSTGYLTTTSRQSLSKGQVYDPYHPRICGVGYYGEGEFVGRKDGKITKEYNAWISMLHRCYDAERQIKDKTYVDCTVHPNWHNFQNFAGWFTKQNLYNHPGSELDKDLMVRDNKIYCEEFCCLLPKKINSTLAFKRYERETKGVWFCEEENKYRVCSFFNGKSKIIGRFTSKEEASDFYKLNKERTVRGLAEEFKDLLDDRVYLMLSTWEFG